MPNPINDGLVRAIDTVLSAEFERRTIVLGTLGGGRVFVSSATEPFALVWYPDTGKWGVMQLALVPVGPPVATEADAVALLHELADQQPEATDVSSPMRELN